MAEALPRNVRLKLDQTLAQWPHWRCEPPLPAAPHIEGRLLGGLSNYSVLVVAGPRRFVIRVDGVRPSAHGLNRQAEWRALRAASARALAPSPRYFNPDLGTLVCDYLDPDPEQPRRPQDIARLLRGIHNLPAMHSRLDLLERIQRYERQFNDETARSSLAPLRTATLQRLATCEERDGELTLCHNDLLAANRLYSNGVLHALDWEYCAMASPWYDLGVIIAGDSLDEQALGELLRGYLEREPSTGELQLALDYSCVYRYVELLWYLSRETGNTPAALIEEKTAQLAAALGGELPNRGNC